MVRKGNLAIFEGSIISETEEFTPTKIVLHAFYINAYLHDRIGGIFHGVKILRIGQK